MCSKSRVANIKNARQVAMYILSRELGMSTPKIAAEVGVKDHTTVMHACRKIENEIKENGNTKLIVDSVKNLILNSN